MLPDRSVLIGQKLVENAKIQKFKCDILSDFQTLWSTIRVLSFMQQLNELNRTIFGAKIQINYGFKAHNFTQNPLANVFFNY